MVELITLIELGFLAATCIGLGVGIGSLSALPLLFLIFVSHGIMILSFQQFFGSLAQRLSRQFRATLMLLPLAAVSLSWLLPELIERTHLQTFSMWTDRLDTVSSFLPARFLLESAWALHEGSSTLGTLFQTMIVSILVTTLVMGMAFGFVARERPLVHENQDVQPGSLWSFGSPMIGIARLQWASLLQSLPGRFGLVMPLFTIILIRGPLALLLSGKSWSVPIAFYYASVAGANLLFNQFGLDRHGVKGLFLLPIEPIAILRGKILGFAAWQALQALMLVGLLMLTGHWDAREMLVGLLLYGVVFILLAMVGQFTSIWNPNPLKKNGLRAAQPPLSVMALMFGTLGMAGFGSVLLLGLVGALLPGWEIPILLLSLLLLGGVFYGLMNIYARYLVQNRETLVEVLGSEG
jgi:hypothetical protein